MRSMLKKPLHDDYASFDRLRMRSNEIGIFQGP
jgi:hypothetical protein